MFITVSMLSLSFNDGDFSGREVVEFINQFVYLLVGCVKLTLEQSIILSCIFFSAELLKSIVRIGSVPKYCFVQVIQPLRNLLLILLRHQKRSFEFRSPSIYDGLRLVLVPKILTLNPPLAIKQNFSEFFGKGENKPRFASNGTNGGEGVHI